LEISQLRSLLALKEFTNLTLAADRLELSTSAIFCHIRQLEQEIGKKLYQQIGKNLRFTHAGEQLAKAAVQIVAMHDASVSSLRENGNSKKGLIRIGCGAHASVKIVPHLTRAFLAAHPNTEVRVITSSDEALLSDLRSGILDAVFLSLPVSDAELVEEPLWSYEMALVTPPRSGGSAGTASFLKRESLPTIFYRCVSVGDINYQLFGYDFGLECNLVIESDQPGAIGELVKLGLGRAVLPYWSVIDDQRKGLLRVSRLRNLYLHNYGVISRRSGYRPKALDNLLTVAKMWREWWPLASHVHDAVQCRP
jgi:DNA-binding transcriptional LysR family regulator